mgnify:CR=1 FL=1
MGEWLPAPVAGDYRWVLWKFWTRCSRRGRVAVQLLAERLRQAGQSAGQRILARLAREIPAAVDHALSLDDDRRQAAGTLPGVSDSLGATFCIRNSPKCG